MTDFYLKASVKDAESIEKIARDEGVSIIEVLGEIVLGGAAVSQIKSQASPEARIIHVPA